MLWIDEGRSLRDQHRRLAQDAIVSFLLPSELQPALDARDAAGTEAELRAAEAAVIKAFQDLQSHVLRVWEEVCPEPPQQKTPQY